MRQTKTLMILGMLLLIGISACTSNPTGKASEEPIKIGAILMLTGNVKIADKEAGLDAGATLLTHGIAAGLVCLF